MKNWLVACFAALALAAGAAEPATPTALAEGVWLLPGGFLPGRQPDGNTVILRGREGLVVVDTGRHEWHVQAILAFARREGRPITAIANTHWHLDHASGNEAIRRAHPAARVFTSNAIDRVIREIWPASTASLQAYLAKNTVPPGLEQDIRGDIHAQTHPAPMRPDEPVTASSRREIDGRRLEVNLAPHAATDGDVWLFDPATRTAIAGDLVTLPVPFLDTACVHGWRAALAQLDAAPFERLVPGHGPVLDRGQFRAWRSAFERYAQCAASDAPAADCTSRWLADTVGLRDRGPGEDARANEMAQGYVALLRRNGGNSAQCRAG